jgi:hypothetical protein
MKKVIHLKEKPAGYCTNAARAGEPALIQYRGVSLSSSGRDFIRKVEAFPNQILEMAYADFHASTVKRFVAIIHENLETEVHLNDFDIYAEALVTRSVEAGDAVRKSDLHHFDKMILEGIEFPKDCGYVIILNNGWERILFWDFGPLLENENYAPIDYDVGRLIATGFSASVFPEIFDLNDDEWRKIIASGWFPFSYLDYEQQLNLLNYLKLDWDTQEIEQSIDQKLCDDSNNWLSKISNNEKIKPHYALIEKSMKYHLNEDYDASIHILYPRIEALLREDFIRANPQKQGRQQSALSSHISTNVTKHTHTITRLLPDRFGEYLNKHYFKDFNVTEETDFISRNTVSHGKNPTSSFTRKASLIGFLILDQIHQYTHLSNTFELRIQENEEAAKTNLE